MNLKKEMVIIDNQFRDDIISCTFSSKSNNYIVRYFNSSKLYYFSKTRIRYLTNPTLIKLDNFAFYINDQLLENIKEIYEFNYYSNCYYRVFFYDNSYANFKSDELRKINKNPYRMIEYMKRVSSITSLSAEDGSKLLCKQMEKIKIDDLDSALANYLKISDDLTKPNAI